MKSIIFVLFSVAAVFATTQPLTVEDGVCILTKDNFDKVIDDFTYVLVEFYAPWCGHCQRLAPEYSQAAQKLADANSNIKLCKVNAEDETDLAERFNIGGFPTLKFFRSESTEPVEYTGGRTASEIIAWLNKKTSSPTVEVNSVEEAQKTLSENGVVALFFGPSTTEAWENFKKAAVQFDEVIFISSNNDEVKRKYEGKDNTFVLFLDNGAERIEFAGESTFENVNNFINKNRFPLVMPFNQEAAQRIFGEELDSLFLLVADNDAGKQAAEAFKQVANKFKESTIPLIFSLAHIEEDFGGKLAEFIGIEEKDLPAVRLIQPSLNMRKFLFTGEVTAETLKTFINDFQADKLKPYLRSQEIPAEPFENGVRIIVATNFNEVVLDSTKDVLIEFYAPWCGHCKQLAPIYESIASRLKESSNLVIAKMDATANEVESVVIEGFPTIKFYPSNKKDEPIEYLEERNEESFIQFIKQHATVTIKDSKPEGSSTTTSETTHKVDQDL